MMTLYAATGDDVVRIVQQPNGSWRADTVLQDAGAQTVAIDPDDPRRLYVGTFDDGALRSLDGGRSWRPVGEDIPSKRVLSVAISPSRTVNGSNAVYLGTEPSSLYVSEDDGNRWHDLAALRDLPSAPTWSFPPRPWTSHVRWIAPSWHDPELLFVGIELGGVMRSTDGGETWEDRKPGSYHDSHSVMTHPAKRDRIYEAAGEGVAVSQDAGDTWRATDAGMDRHYSWAIALDPEDPDHWFVSASIGPRYAHGDQKSSEARIFRKRGAAAWEPLTTGLGDPMSEMPYAMLIPRDDRSHVYAGTRQGRLYLSQDQGDSWQRCDVQVPAILAMAHALGE